MNIKAARESVNSTSKIGFLPDLCSRDPLLVMLILSLLLAVLFELITVPINAFDAQRFLINCFGIVMITLSSSAMLCALRPYINRWRPALTALFSFGVILFTTAIINMLFMYVLRFDTAETKIMLLIRILLVAAILGGIALRYFYLQQQVYLHRESELERRIEALQARIRPHFLFNSLNTIASLVVIDADKAETAIEDLSDLFRASLSKDSYSTVEDELDLCRRYLRMEKLRLGARLKIDWQVDEQLKYEVMPHLLLQPLMENAIYHGIQPIPEGGLVCIELSRTGNMMHVEITNPMPQYVVSYERQTNRMALDNIRSRLDALYGKKGLLITEYDEQQYKAIIHYPLTTKKS